MAETKHIKKTGQEPFVLDGNKLPSSILSFWQWSGSGLVGNTQRGVLAEFIVAHALECVQGVRQEWEAYDIKANDGIRVEIKSAAYVQSWQQDKPSSIRLGIRPTIGWNAATNTWSEGRSRQADVHLKRVFTEIPKATCVEDIEALLPFKPEAELEQAA